MTHAGITGATFVSNQTIIGTFTQAGVTLYDSPNFDGQSRLLPVGEYRFLTPEDFNDLASSVRVPPGLCAILYEHADEGGGYGAWVDLLEDCADLSTLGFDNKTSYVTVFASTRGTFVWARNAIVNGQFVPGHWERQRVGGTPPNPTPVVAPPLPSHQQPVQTTLQVSGGDTMITALGQQSVTDNLFWQHATTDQLGIIGSDFRGPENIGSAAFERASNNELIPDSFNFWYPQRQPNDHREMPYFKRTLVGKVQDAHVANISGTYQDFDVNIDVVPNESYQYLLKDGHAREYTSIMSAEWTLSLHSHGQPDCNDAQSVAEFSFVECEVQPNADPHAPTAQLLVDAIKARGSQEIGTYGPWIYDRGHCCHSEIHPSEQIWWRDDLSPTQRRYSCNLFCDASKRFWWRDQMDDGVKLKPWGAPPIRGIFAIAFEAQVGKPSVSFDVAHVDDYNVEQIPNADQVYRLIYQNNPLVTFTPHNNVFKVSFENVGTAGPNVVRGFLVIETSVGTLTQKQAIPPGQDVNTVDQSRERAAFEKVEGHYMFTVTETRPG